jgi:hypothetical protein
MKREIPVSQKVKEKAAEGLKRRKAETFRSEGSEGSGREKELSTVPESEANQSPVPPQTAAKPIRRVQVRRPEALWEPAPGFPDIDGPEDWPTMKEYAEERYSSCARYLERTEEEDATKWKAEREQQLVEVQAATSSLGRHDARQILDALARVNIEDRSGFYFDEDENWTEAQDYLAKRRTEWTDRVTELRDAIPAPAPVDPQELRLSLLRIWGKIGKTSGLGLVEDADNGCEERAHAICQYLVDNGIPDSRVHKRWVRPKEHGDVICGAHRGWIQHVTAAVDLGDSELVLDPVFNPPGCMTYGEWKGNFEDAAVFSSEMPRSNVERPEF